MSPYAPNAYGSGFAYGGGYYGGAGYYAGEPNAVDPSSVAAQQAPHPTGMLRLSMTPSSAQVFVDSYYVGTVADIEAVPELLPEVWQSTPLRVWSFLEMTGIRSRRQPKTDKN